MVALTTAAPIATVASAVAVVELLILRPPAVVATLVALVPRVVPVFARLPGLSGFPRSRLVLAKLSRWRLLLVTWLARFAWLTRLTRLRRGLADGCRRRGGRDVLDGNGCLGTRRGLGHVAVIGRRLGGPVEVRVRLASVFGGLRAVRARPTAATMRASTFGHATMFVMGFLLAVAPVSAGLLAVLL